MKFAILTDVTFPTDHSFIEEVYSKRFSERRHDVTFLMRRKKGIREKQTTWNECEIHLIRGEGFRNMIQSVISVWDSVCRTYGLLKKLRPDVVLVRNDPIFALMAAIYKRRKKIPFVYQYTFPKSTQKMMASGIHKKIFFAVRNWVSRKMENIIFSSADLILPISDYMTEQFIEKGIDKSNLSM